MRLRHRLPTIFSLSMLDVLCCGLGAVILLMLLNYWDARRQATALAAARKNTEQVARDLAATRGSLSNAEIDLQMLQWRCEESSAEVQQLSRDLDAAKTGLLAAEREHKRLRSLYDQASADLRKADKERTRLLTRTAEVEKQTAETSARLARTQIEADRVPGLQEQIRTAEKEKKSLETERAALRKQVETALLQVAERERNQRRADEQLGAAAKRTKDAETEISRVQKEMAEIARRLRAEAEKRIQAADMQLADLRKQLDAQREAAKVVQVKMPAIDDRFAGVDLQGRRVVFLVDISGSMGSIDAETPDANKWPEVTGTVVRLLKSLPRVEKYQIILFSDTTLALLGRTGEWLDYDPAKSPDEVTLALARVIPRGNTNMYAAFEAAFQLKASGLDAIYVFSDGLPNTGPGLPNPPPRDENAQATILGRFLRETIRNRWNRNLPRVQIHAVGFFYESPNLGAFLWALTRENGGSFVGMSKP